VRWLDGFLIVTVAITALVALPRVAGAVGSGMGDLVASIQTAIPLLQGQANIQLPAGGSTSVGAAPVVEGIPQYTREPQLQIKGKVPSFAVQSGRILQIILNGSVIVANPLDPSGAFGAALALKEGSNAIAVTLLSDQDVVATSSYVVVLDRTPPTVTVSRPQPGSTLDSQNIIVQGTSEPGATITVNDHTVVTAPDGSFSDSFPATPGNVQITVVSRDRAGNETTQKISVVAIELPQTVTTTVSVTLDNAKVKPSQTVIATIRVMGPTGPRAGVPATLSVGIVTIGTAITDGTGTARIGFAAPPNEGEANVVVLAAGASGRAPLTIAAR
jgi:hypothetical protein